MTSQVGFVWSLLLASGIARADHFEGTISGNAIVALADGPLAIVGMRVELFRTGGDTPLATSATGEEGAFALDYEYSTITDDTIDLYLKFVAETEDGMIRVRKRNLVVGREIRSETFRYDNAIVVDSNDLLATGTVDLGEISLDPQETRPQLLHWANRARQFVDAQFAAAEEDSPLPDDPSKPLDIMDSPIPWDKSGGFFFPAKYQDELIAGGGALFGQLTGAPGGLWVVVGFAAWVAAEFSDQDCIYLAKTVAAQTSDQGVFHEFGHYFMYQAQGESWLDIFEAGFVPHGDSRNASNPKLAWTEGWADGFGFMVDSWSADDDGKGHGDDTLAVDAVPSPAGAILCKGGGSGCSQQAVTHGFYSEHFIGSALYDLWDGPNNLSNSSVAQSDDDGGTDAIDDMNLADLAAPILGSEDDLVTDIVDYHDRLVDLDLAPNGQFGGELGFDRSLTELFTSEDKPNKVRNVSDDLSTPEHAFRDLLNTDGINFSREIEVQTFKEKNGALKEANKYTATFTVDVPVLFGLDDNFNFCPTGSAAVSEPLLDDLEITGTTADGAATLGINLPGNRGFALISNSYGVPSGSVACASPEFAVTVGGNADLTVINQGSIIIGEDASPGRTAHLTLAEGATLTLGGGPGGDNPSEEYPGGPLVSKGKLHINPGSSLVVELGAQLIIKQGAVITLDESELIIRGDLIVEEDATFQWTAINGGMLTFDLEDRGGDPNLTMEPNSTIFVSETAFTIASGTYVMPTSDNPVGPRTIVIEHGSTGLFGEDAYLDTTGTGLTLWESTIEALNPPDKHNGVRLDDNTAFIDTMTFSGGWKCIEELGSVPGVQDPLLITSSTFADCTTAIQVDDRSLELYDVTIDDGVTGVLATGAADVTVGYSAITRQTEHGLDLAQGAGASVISSTFAGNLVGIEVADGAALRLEDVTTIQQNSVGVRAANGATVNAGYVGTEPSNTIFDRNGVGIQLLDAAVPILAGDNAFFEASGAGVRSISGTIDDGGACGAGTIIVDADTWNDRVGGPGGGFHPPVSLTLSPYSINSSTGGCSYTLVQ